MTENEFIDDGSQKAFLKAVNGCTEHVQVLSEIFQDAKQKRKTVHVCWYDLSDAYGSIPHQLIEFCLKLYHIPQEEINYIRNLYSQLRGVVVTKKWKSNPFLFRNGIFTGDTYSPIVFNVTFQPLIDFIRRKKENAGYNLSNRRIITKPFADDFELADHIQPEGAPENPGRDPIKGNKHGPHLQTSQVQVIVNLRRESEISGVFPDRPSVR